MDKNTIRELVEGIDSLNLEIESLVAANVSPENLKQNAGMIFCGPQFRDHQHMIRLGVTHTMVLTPSPYME